MEAVGVSKPVHELGDGKQAMAYLAGTGKYSDRQQYPLPYLMLLDLKLPHVMGLDLLRWMREKAGLKSIIVLVLTASNSPSDIDAAYQAGASGYLVKTSRFDKLQVMVQSIKDFWLTHNRPGSGFFEES